MSATIMNSLGYHVHRYQGFQASEPLSRAAPVAQRSAEQSRAEQSIQSTPYYNAIPTAPVACQYAVQQA
ncbi:NCS1 nucleoside transporter family protein [Metarhizium robertsii ARSEF 23]|uniref:NCS1 nucleoside transporter family protein n=1 Tax=Metarhizium robertsii (strain ARSEF 23 / ATCC MYA-3075) TaxID=655844 RepID=A0A0B2XG67_METRA|nr:NCS1 nucleoside transporter family protein [Metarhizium robertsii ARSEF 23]KHO11009.1 NCS1 nucleoside transporter family protein [Metarhizium robertsii ARSEF 23]